MVQILTQIRSSIQKPSPINFIAKTDPGDGSPMLGNLDWLDPWHCGHNILLYQMGLAQEMQKGFRVPIFKAGYQTLYLEITLDKET